jgi:hypothetical protein
MSANQVERKSSPILAVVFSCLIAILACNPLGGVGDQQVGETASVGDRAWVDEDGDGIQDAGEQGLAGVTVGLQSSDGSYDERQQTNDDGAYLFDQLPPGSYFLVFEAPPDYSIAPQDQGDDDAVDSDPDPATGETDVFDIVEAESSQIWDAGFVPADSGPRPTPVPEVTPTPTPLIRIPGGDYLVSGTFTEGAGGCGSTGDFQVPELLVRLEETQMWIIQGGLHENVGPLDRADGFFDVSTGKGDGSEGYTGNLMPDGSASGEYRYTTAAGTCTWQFELTPLE